MFAYCCRRDSLYFTQVVIHHFLLAEKCMWLTPEFNLAKQIECHLVRMGHLPLLWSGSLAGFDRQQHRLCDLYLWMSDTNKPCMWPYLVDEVSYVSWVGGSRADGVLVVMMEGPLIQASDSHLDTLGLQGIRLLQLTQIIVLDTHIQMLVLQ